MEHIIIVGAGLVGCLLSKYMARAGFKVSVYDRNPDPRSIDLQSGRSINITLCERGFKALDRVGAGDKVRKFCIPIYGRVMHSKDKNDQGVYESIYQPYGNNQEALYSIERKYLGRELLNFAEQDKNIDFYFNEKCVNIDLSTATLDLHNLETGEIKQVKGDRIFGSDGANSVVRQKMQRLKRFNYSQEYCDQGYKEIIIPPCLDGSWELKKNAIHVWPRDDFMLIGFPNLDGSFTLSLHLPYEGKISLESIDSPRALQEFFEIYFPDVLPMVKSSLKDYFEKPVGTMITIKCFPWTYEDKIALIGDSCHAIFPSLGQGANSGFEDCVVLDQCLKNYSGDWAKIFREYENQRKPNLDAIADLCYEHFTVLRKMLGDPNFLRRSQIERDIQKRYPNRASLYYNVSFTNIPYLQAVKFERTHQALINKIIEIEDIEDNLGISSLVSLVCV